MTSPPQHSKEGTQKLYSLHRRTTVNSERTSHITVLWYFGRKTVRSQVTQWHSISKDISDFI